MSSGSARRLNLCHGAFAKYVTEWALAFHRGLSDFLSGFGCPSLREAPELGVRTYRAILGSSHCIQTSMSHRIGSSVCFLFFASVASNAF